MPIKVRYNNDQSQECVIRPTPFVQISEEINKNKVGNFGVTYTIVLTGTLLADEGTPFAVNPADNTLLEIFGDAEQLLGDPIGPFGQFDNKPISQRSRPPRQKVTKPASAILSKQRALRALFARDGQTLIITDIFDDAPATIYCNPRVVSIDFTEGNYVNKCEYTINLQADVLLRGDIEEDAFIDQGYTQVSGQLEPRINFAYDAFVAQSGLFIEDFSEDWSLEADDGGESVLNPKQYRISHNLSATGKKHYGNNGVEDKEAWEQARDFVQARMSNSVSGSYPNVAGIIGSGTINLVDSYQGYNHVRTEQINVAQGSYSVTENWVLSSGTSTETYNATTSTSTSEPFIKVDINGTIKGLSQIGPSGFYQSSVDINEVNQASGAFANALKKYNEVSNSGKFGLSSDLFKRADNLVSVELNSQPTSVSLATNEFTGDVTYSLSFDNRPTNIISGVLSETISVNDTYPGDVFAVIPVLGRRTGPVLQYIGGRTEYKRDISLSLVMDYTKVPYGSGRNTLLLKKPSLVEPTASQIATLLKELSPAGEPGIRKYFVAPPQESWNPKEGTYSFNISFTYELDR